MGKVKVTQYFLVINQFLTVFDPFALLPELLVTMSASLFFGKMQRPMLCEALNKTCGHNKVIIDRVLKHFSLVLELE